MSTSDTPPRDPPIEPLPYTGGVKVVDIGDLRVARGMSRRPLSTCRHKQLVYDQEERRIWCQDCEANIEAFDAFENLVAGYSQALNELHQQQNQLVEANKFQARSIAAKVLDEAWRSRTMVPACPHCGQGLFPEDFTKGCSTLGREYAEALARRKARPTP